MGERYLTGLTGTWAEVAVVEVETKGEISLEQEPGWNRVDNREEQEQISKKEGNNKLIFKHWGWQDRGANSQGQGKSNWTPYKETFKVQQEVTKTLDKKTKMQVDLRKIPKIQKTNPNIYSQGLFKLFVYPIFPFLFYFTFL